MQIFPGPRFRLLCQGTIVHCFLFMISTFITEILSCIPVEDAWTNWRGESNAICYDNSAFWWAHSVGHPRYTDNDSLTLAGYQHRHGSMGPRTPNPNALGSPAQAEEEDLSHAHVQCRHRVRIPVNPPNILLTPLVSPSSASSASRVC